MPTSTKHLRALKAAETITPRCGSREEAAAYLGVSTDVIDRMVQTGAIPVVRLPVARGPTGRGVPGVLKRIIIDFRDLDRLVDRAKEKVG